MKEISWGFVATLSILMAIGLGTLYTALTALLVGYIDISGLDIYVYFLEVVLAGFGILAGIEYWRREKGR
jgi:hypothetical protein